MPLNLKTGWLCLDFANTAEWHASDSPEESLHNYHDLLAWGRKTALLNKATADYLHRSAAADPGAAQRIYSDAIDLREAIYRIFSAVAAGSAPAPSDLDRLNGFLALALTNLRVTPSGGGFDWGWSREPALDRILWPVAWSASTLLTSNLLDRVGQCADDRGCGWLFLDMSRNRSRRWCDMKDCGNRDKVRRYYARKRISATSAAQS